MPRHGLEIDRVARIGLDLAAQAVDLHVDGSFAGVVSIDENVTRHGLSRIGREDPQQIAFALGQPDRIGVLLQVAATKMEGEGAECDLVRRYFLDLAALEDVGDPQEEFAWLEGLCKVVLDAGLEAAHAVVGFRARRQQENRLLGRLFQVGGKIETGLAGHHHVENQQVEGQAFHLPAGLGGIAGGADPVVMFGKEAAEQRTDAPVIVDDEKMAGTVFKCVGFGRSCDLAHLYLVPLRRPAVP